MGLVLNSLVPKNASAFNIRNSCVKGGYLEEIMDAECNQAAKNSSTADH